MWRWVISDYFKAFRWSRMREYIKKDGWLWWLYFVIGLPLISGFFSTKENALTYTIMGFPLAFWFFTAILQESALPKIFYLSPMEKPVREAYMERKYIFAILFPAVLGSIFAFLLWRMGLSEPLTAVLFYLDLLILACCSSGLKAPELSKKSIKQRDSAYVAYIVHGVDTALACISAYGMLLVLCLKNESVESWCKWIFAGVMILVQIPLTIKHLSGWKKAVERAVDYGRSVV